jgi:hypothetical protein
MKISLLINATLLGPNIPLSTLFSKTLNTCSYIQVNYQISNPCKTTGTQKYSEINGRQQAMPLLSLLLFLKKYGSFLDFLGISLN